MFEILRTIFSFVFVYLVSGFPLAKLFLPDEKKVSLKLFLTSFSTSLFLTYPAAVLTTMLEGQSAAAIYQGHLPHSLFSLSLFFFLCLIILWWRQPHWYRLSFPKLKIGHLFLFAIILIYSFFVFWNLGRADVVGDDYDLAYQAYDLQDGIQAARKAYIISFNTHPPLFMTIKHYWFQVLFPNGLATIPSWGYRGMEGFMGIATILAVYAITKNYWAPAILAVNNYMIFLGRVYLREMYLTFFITLSIYFFLKKKYLITAFLIGCGLLVKTSAIVVLPVYLLILLYRREFKNILRVMGVLGIMYLPVLLYNFLAYLTTGHMDATFSRIFGIPHPFLTGSSAPLENLTNIFNYLKDIYSLLILAMFLISVVVSLIKRKDHFYVLILGFSVIYFVFGGPLREYYLLFMTIPFAVLAAKLPRVIIVLLVVISLWYTVSGQSVARKIFEPVKGWSELANKVKSLYQPGDCLTRSGGVNDLAMRAYFQTDDTPKKILLGSNYPHDYKMCDEVEKPARTINIFYNRLGIASYQIL